MDKNATITILNNKNKFNSILAVFMVTRDKF
jgi:hypothetical protein